MFIGSIKGNQKLYDYLSAAGYKLIFKPTLEYNGRGGKKIKGNVDAELVLYSIIEYPNYDKAIIVAGDGDYYCLLEYLEAQNKLYKILVPNKYSYSSLLRKFIPYMVYVSELKNELEGK